MKTKASLHRSGAFTLLELLVAMTMLTLITGMLAVVVSQISKIWRTADAHIQRQMTGRALLQFIVRDLEMAMLQTPYPAAKSPNLRFIANLPGFIPEAILNPHAIFWQAPVAMNRSKGDLAEVGYFVRWDTTSLPGVAKAQLCRFMVDPSDVDHYQIYTSTLDGLPVQWPEGGIIDRVAPATAAQDHRGWFADHVIALWVRCLDRAGNPILATADGSVLNGGYGYDSEQGYRSPALLTPWPTPLLPASVEVVLVTVDARTAMRIATPIVATPTSPMVLWGSEDQAGSLAHFLAGIPPEIRSGVEVFSTRVSLKNANP